MSSGHDPDRGTVIFSDGKYSVVLSEVGPLWSWVIEEDGTPIQEGASISESAARRDSDKVVAVFRRMGPSIRAARERGPEEGPWATA